MYRPHVVVGDSEYLGVQFDLPSELRFDIEYVLNMYPLYKNVDYSPLVEGASFSIMEGGKKVGEGRVIESTRTDADHGVRLQT